MPSWESDNFTETIMTDYHNMDSEDLQIYEKAARKGLLFRRLRKSMSSTRWQILGKPKIKLYSGQQKKKSAV